MSEIFEINDKIDLLSNETLHAIAKLDVALADVSKAIGGLESPQDGGRSKRNVIVWISEGMTTFIFFKPIYCSVMVMSSFSSFF